MLIAHNISLLLVFLSLLDLRNDRVTILVHLVHFCLVLKSFSDLVDGSVNDIDERF